MSRIKDLREQRGISMRKVAEEIGIPYTTYVNYEKGDREPNSEMLIVLANYFKVSIDYLLGRTDSHIDERPLESTNTSLRLVSPTVTDDVVTFPVVGEIAAGYNCIANEDWSGDTVSVPALYLKGRPTSDFFVLSVKGNSMYPLYQAGDTVLILKQDYIENSGDIGAVMYDNECATLKKVEILKDMVRLVSVNPEYQPKEIKGNDLELYHVLGVPRLLIREFD